MPHRQLRPLSPTTPMRRPSSTRLHRPSPPQPRTPPARPEKPAAHPPTESMTERAGQPRPTPAPPEPRGWLGARPQGDADRNHKPATVRQGQPGRQWPPQRAPTPARLSSPQVRPAHRQRPSTRPACQTRAEAYLPERVRRQMIRHHPPPVRTPPAASPAVEAPAEVGPPLVPLHAPRPQTTTAHRHPPAGPSSSPSRRIAPLAQARTPALRLLATRALQASPAHPALLAYHRQHQPPAA